MNSQAQQRAASALVAAIEGYFASRKQVAEAITRLELASPGNSNALVIEAAGASVVFDAAGVRKIVMADGEVLHVEEVAHGRVD